MMKFRYVLLALLFCASAAFGQELNVRAFGAKCNGSTNDATALAAALSAAGALSNGGTVLVPQGTCLTGSTLTIPSKVTLYLKAGATIKNTGAVDPLISLTLGAAGTSAHIIGEGMNSIIEYTSTGDALYANGTGQSNADLYIANVWIKGSASGASGLRLKAFNKGATHNIRVSGFSAGSAIKNEGANTINHFSPELVSNAYGINNLTAIVSANNYSSNGINVYGGQIRSNVTWGWIEDDTGGGGTNQGNHAFGVVFEVNGANASGVTGNVYVKNCDSCGFIGSYFEYAAGLVPLHQITIGDGATNPSGTYITGNVFLSVAGVTNTILANSGRNMYIVGNVENGVPTNFYNQATAPRGVHLGPNKSGATNYFAGLDSGSDTYIYGGAVTNVNSLGTTIRGFGFNQISGFNQDLIINTRGGGTNTIRFQRIDGTQTGAWTDAGMIFQNGVAFAALGTPANGHHIYCTDCTIANPCAGAGTGALAKRLNGVWVCN